MTSSDKSEASATTSSPPVDVVIIGAGPAGLTAAYMLTKRGHAATVLESDNVVGGISRTANATVGASTSAAIASSPR